MLQNCGGAAAIAGTRTLRLAGSVNISFNWAGSGGGGAICVVADLGLSLAAETGSVPAFVAGPAPAACANSADQGEGSFAAAAAASPYMVDLLIGARAEVFHRKHFYATIMNYS